MPEAVHAMELLDLKHEDMSGLEALVRNDIKQIGTLFATNAINGHS